MYICTWVFVSNERALPQACARAGHGGGAPLARAPADGSARARNPARANSATYSCLWFQKCVHLWPKLNVLSAHVFFKNKTHLRKRSFSSIPLPAGRQSTAANYLDVSVTPHPSWGRLQFPPEGKHYAHSGSKCTPMPERGTQLWGVRVWYVGRGVSEGLTGPCGMWEENSQGSRRPLPGSVIVVWHTDPSGSHSVYNELNACRINSNYLAFALKHVITMKQGSHNCLPRRWGFPRRFSH